jgi:hypothetical protein
VFFFVLQGLDEGRVLSGGALRWVASVVFGGAVGMGIGFLMAQVGELPPVWFVTVGGAAAALATMVLLEVRRRMKPAIAAPRVIPHAGLK